MLLLLVLLQVTLMPYFAVAHVQPDLVLVAVACWALWRGATEGAIGGFVGGLGLDMLSGGPFGMHTFILTIVGVLAGFGTALIPSEHWLLLPGMILLSTIVQQAAEVWLLRAAGWPLYWSQVLIPVVVPAVLLNLLVVVPLYPLLGLLHRRTAPEEAGW